MANENEGVQTTATTTEQTKYLDKKGLETFWGKVKALVTAAVGTFNDLLNKHLSDYGNPHKVTKAQVGLGNVDNTSDAAKPVSTAQATAIADAKKAGTDAASALATHKNDKGNPHGVTKGQVGLGNVTNDAQVKRSEMGKANGVATLDSDGKVNESQLPTLDLSLYIIVDKLPTTGQKTNKIYLVKDISKPGNVYTEHVWVNGAWEKLGDFSSEVDLKPYAKLDGGNQFTGQQVVYDDETDYRVQIDHLGVTVGDGDNDLTINNSGIKVTNGSNKEAFATDGTTIDTSVFAKSKDVVSNTTYNTDKQKMTDELGNKLPLSGGTISGNLAVTGTLKKGGKDVLTDHQAIYSLTVQKNGTSVGTFNPKSANATINVTVPTKLSEFTDDNVLKGKYLPLTGGTLTGDVEVSGQIQNVGFGTTVSMSSVKVARNGGVAQGKASVEYGYNDIKVKSSTPDFNSGGSVDVDCTFKFPSTSGTLALDEKFAKYLPLTGGTVTGQTIFSSLLVGSQSNATVIANSNGLTTTTMNAAKIINTNHQNAEYLLCGDGTVAERIEETEIAAICV